MKLVGLVAMALGVIIVTAVLFTTTGNVVGGVACPSANASWQANNACEHVKNVMWTIVGIVPVGMIVVVFFLLVPMFSSEGGPKPKSEKQLLKERLAREGQLVDLRLVYLKQVVQSELDSKHERMQALRRMHVKNMPDDLEEKIRNAERDRA